MRSKDLEGAELTVSAALVETKREAFASTKIGRFTLVAGSALLLTLGFPPFDLGPVVLLALVPLLMVLAGSTGKQAWRSGYLFGVLFSLGQLHWLDALTAKWTNSVWLGLVPWVAATLAMAVYFGLVGVLIRKCFHRKLFWVIPLVWAGVEVFRTYIPVLAFPWELVATPLWRFPWLIQTAHLGTIFTVSAWVVAVNLSIYLAIWGDRKSKRFLAVLVPALALPVISVGMYFTPKATVPTKITLGQPGIDMAFETEQQVESQVPSIVRDFSAQALASGSRMLILPEGIAKSSNGWDFFDFPLNPKLPILFGGQRGENKHSVYQSAIGFDGNWHNVDKTRLVIFGEFVPGRDFLPFLQAFGLPGGDLSAGKTGVKAMDLGGLRIGPLLCFEGLFPDLAYRQGMNGARMIPVMSDDDWFMNSSAPDQLRAATIWRAVETGTPVVRVGSLGYSLSCDGKGDVLHAVPLGSSSASTVDVPVPDSAQVLPFLPVLPVLFVLGAIYPLLPARGRSETESDEMAN